MVEEYLNLMLDWARSEGLESFVATVETNEREKLKKWSKQNNVHYNFCFASKDNSIHYYELKLRSA